MTAVYDLYKPRGDKLEHIIETQFKKTLNPVSILAEELYHGLFDRFTSYTIASSTYSDRRDVDQCANLSSRR